MYLHWFYCQKNITAWRLLKQKHHELIMQIFTWWIFLLGRAFTEILDAFLTIASFAIISNCRSLMMSEGIIRLNDCNVHVALMGSEFDEQGTVYVVCNYNVTCIRNDLVNEKKVENDVLFSNNTGKLWKRNSECSYQESNLRPCDYYIVLMGAIKLGSWGQRKRQKWSMDDGMNEMPL